MTKILKSQKFFQVILTLSITLILIAALFINPSITHAESTGNCSSCASPPGSGQSEYLSDTGGFKAIKTVTSAGKCLVSVFFPAKKAVVDFLGGVSLTQDTVEFIDKIQKEKPDWLATADTGVTAVNFASNLAGVLSTQYADQMEKMVKKAGGHVPGFSVILDCGSTGYDIYKLVSSYIDAVDFAVDTISISPVKKTLAKNDFYYPAMRWPDGAYAEKYEGDETWRVELRLRQLGGDPSQIGTHWDRIYTMQHWNNGVPLALFYRSDNDELITGGEDFGINQGVATSPKFYTIINEPAFAGAEGVRAGTNTYEFMFAYSTAGFLGLLDGEESANTYFTVYPDANIPADPEDPSDIIDEINDDDDDDDNDLPPEDPPFRTPGRDHADENLSVANKDVPDKTPTDLRNAYVRLATGKGYDLVIIRELLKEARQAEKHFLDLLSQEPENPEYQWKWAGATHRIKIHMAALRGKEKEMIQQFLRTPNVAVLDRGYTDRARKLLKKLHIPTARAGIDFSPDIVDYHPVLLIPSAGLYGLDGSEAFKARLEEYARRGGTIVSLTQQHGYDFKTLPGGELDGYGWLEDQSCHTRSMSIAQLHPILSGQDEAILDAGVDGFFTSMPENAQTLLKRTKNNMPAAVVYPFGQGQVIALCVYSDWISGLGGETRDDRALLADIIHWAESGNSDPDENILGQPVEVTFPVKNNSEEPSTHILYYVLRPDGTIFSSEISELVLEPGESQSIDLSVPGGSPDQPGIWSVDYILMDLDGENRVMNFEEPEIQQQTPGGYFQVRKDIDAVTALNTFNFYITSSQEVYFKNETGTFTFTVGNNSSTEQTLRIRYYFHHHVWEYAKYSPDRSIYGGPFYPNDPSPSTIYQEELTIAAGEQASFDHSVPILGGDRIFANLYTESGTFITTTDRQIMVHPDTEVISISPQQETYEGTEGVHMDFSITPTADRELSGEARITVRDPDNAVVYSSSPITLSGSDPVSLTLSDFVLPAAASPGYYIVNAEIFDSYGIRTGGKSSSFTVPERPVYTSLELPDVIDPQSPAVFNVNLSNTTDEALSTCSLNFYVDGPDAGTVFHETVSIPSLATGQSAYTFNVDFSEVFQVGQYTARYELTCPDPAILRQGQKSFLRDFTYSLQMNRNTYLSGEDAEIRLTAVNSGIFNESINLQLVIDETAVDIQDTVILTAGELFKTEYNFVVPSLGKGSYPIDCTMENFPTLSKSTGLIIKPKELDITFPGDSVSAGSAYVIRILSENSMPLDYAYEFSIIDYYGNTFFETSDNLVIPADNSAAANIGLPNVIVPGNYVGVFDVIDPINSALVQRRQTPLALTGGITVNITSQPNDESYATGDSAAITTQVVSGSTVEVSNAQLEISVNSTIDTGDFGWERTQDVLGSRFVPFDVNTGGNTSLAFSDLDGDGDKDLAAYFNGGLLFYENESILAKQKWTRRTDWSTGYTNSYTYALTLGDLNNDSKPDMIVLDSTYTVRGFKNVGTDGIPAWEEDASLIAGLPATYNVWSIRLIDIDLDGDLDFYAATSSGAKYGYRNTGDITAPVFTSDNSGLCSGLTSPGQVLVFLNLNDDDLIDMLTINRYSTPYTVDYYLNTTPDTSTDITWEKQTAETINWTYNQPSENRWGFENFFGLGGLTEAKLYRAHIQGMVDIDGDQQDDLVISDTEGGIYTYLDDPGNENNTESEGHYYVLAGQVEIIQPFTHPAYIAPVLNFADMDGDGNEEMVVLNYETSTGSYNAAVMKNIGSTAEPEWKRNTDLENAFNEDIAYYQSYHDDYTHIYNISMGDLNGDGLKDAITYGGKPGLYDGRQFRIWSFINQGDYSPDFVETDLLDSVWSTMPHHYRPQPYESPRLVDRCYQFRLRDFDGDGDSDLFISYTWERYGYSYTDYLDTRGTLVAYENTGTAANPVFARKTEWEAGLSEMILATSSSQYVIYGVDIMDFDGDGNFEAIVTKNSSEPVTGYRYEGNTWVLNNDLVDSIVPDDPTRPSVPSLLDLDSDGVMDLALTVYYTGAVETYGISRVEALEIDETTQHTFTGDFSHETDLGVLAVPGRINITAELKSGHGQSLGKVSDHFFVRDSGQSVLLRVKPDKTGYKAGDSVVLSGVIRNLGALDISGTPILSNRETEEILGLNESITLAPDEEYPFSVTVENLTTGFSSQLSFNEFSVSSEVRVIEPTLTVSVDIPEAVKGDGNIEAILLLANPTDIPIDVSVDVEGETDEISILQNQTTSLVKSFTVDQTKTFSFDISGDYSETIEKTVAYETGASVTFDSRSLYAYGTILIPYTVANTGELDDEFILEVSGDMEESVTVNAPAGSETEYILEVNGTELGYGNHQIMWQTPVQDGTIDFSIVRDSDPLITEFDFTGLTGNDTDGYHAGFNCTVKNQGINSFAGQLLLEIPDVSRKRENIVLEPGQEQQLQLTIPAPQENGEYTCTAALVLENQTVADVEAAFNVISGLTVTGAPENLSGAANEDLVFDFTVENTGLRSETMSAMFTMPFGFGTDNSKHSYLNSGAQESLSFTVFIPGDVPAGEYNASLIVNGVNYNVPFSISGVDLDVDAALDKDVYSLSGDDTCTLTLAVTNTDSGFNGTELTAVAAYNGYQQVEEFSLQDSNNIEFIFDVTTENARINWGIYQSGRSLILDDSLVRTVSSELPLYTDHGSYMAGDNVTLDFTPESSGTLTLHIPDMDWEQVLEVTSGQAVNISIPLSEGLPSGTYVMVAKMDNGEGVTTRILYFDINGITIRPTEFTLSKQKYLPSDTIQANITIESNLAFQGHLNATISTEAGTVTDLYSGQVSILKGLNEISFSGELETQISGTHFVNIKITDSAESENIYTTCSKAFDVGGIMLLGIGTEQKVYSGTAESVLLNIQAFGTEPGDAEISINEEYFTTVSLTPQSPASAQVEIPAEELSPGSVFITAAISNNGLTSSKQTSFLFGQDLPDLSPASLGITMDGSQSVISVLVQNTGGSTAPEAEVIISQEGGADLGTILIGEIEPGQSVTGELIINQNLGGQTLAAEASMTGGDEKDLTNNRLVMTIETANQSPEITFVAPASDESYGNIYEAAWTAEDADGDTLSVDIYLDDDKDAENGKIAMLLDAANTGSASLNMTTVPSGIYYLYIIVKDSNNGVASAFSAGRIGIPEIDDEDEDGIADETDNCPADSNPLQEDADGDEYGDACDLFPEDSSEWADADSDGTGDNSDGCPDDPGKQSPGVCGCGVADADTDGDQVYNCEDMFPDNGDEWEDFDLDGIGNNGDTDDDDDGMPDEWETAFGLDTLYAADAEADADGDGLSNLDEYLEGRDPTNQPPSKPVLALPSDDAVDVVLPGELSTEDYDDPEDDDHAHSIWQISVSPDDFSAEQLVLNVETDLWLTSLSIPDFVLQADKDYYWRVKFIDSVEEPSDWSEVFIFSTITENPEDTNGNGVFDDQEITDSTVDLDDDDTPDISQSGLLCANTVVGNGQIAVKGVSNVTSVDAITSIDPVEINDTENRPEELPFGLINFKVKVTEPGDTAQIEIFFSEPLPENSMWYKYDSINGWQDFTDNAVFNPDRFSVTVTLVDGGTGDADGAVNGIIVDPSGISGTAVSNPLPVKPRFFNDEGGCFIDAVAGESHSCHICLMFFILFGSIVFIRCYLKKSNK